MTDIQKLLDKYQASYVPGEIRSKQYNTRIQKQHKYKNRINTLNTINKELPYSIKLNKSEKEVTASIIETFNEDLKYLHRQATEEQIILSIIYTIKKRIKPELTLNKDKYPIFARYRLTYPMLTTILSRLCNYYMLHNPQVIRQTTRYDHEILYKQNNSPQRII
jgi:hypothetical protein